jgi:uncharacterized OB-fold protein
MSGTRYTRLRRNSERFIGFECQECGWVSFPEERETCKRCGAVEADFESVQLSRRGRIRSFVVQQYSPEGLSSPQPIAVVDVTQESNGDPARTYGLLTDTDPDDIEIGAAVEARFRMMFEVGDRPIHAFKFVLVEGDTE